MPISFYRMMMDKALKLKEKIKQNIEKESSNVGKIKQFTRRNKR